MLNSVRLILPYFYSNWQKIADYLSADLVSSDDIMNIIDLNELWRGKIQIWERKVKTFFICGYFLKHLCTSFKAFIVQCILCLNPNLVSTM